MKENFASDRGSYLDVPRNTPNLGLFQRRWQLSALSIFILGSAAVISIGWEEHPGLAVFSILLLVSYALIDRRMLDKYTKREPDRWYQIWNLGGMALPIAIYLLMIRGMGPAGPVALWPLLAFPLYFLVRLFRYSPVFPKILIPYALLAVIAAIAPFLLTPEPDIRTSLASAFWLVALLMVIIVFTRSWTFYKNRFSAYREIIAWGGSDSADLGMLQQKVEDLSAHLQLEHLSILEVFRPEPDSAERNREEEGLEAQEDADVEAIRPPKYVRPVATVVPGLGKVSWPLTRGLIKRACEKRAPVSCEDTLGENCTEYYRLQNVPALENTRSELVIPIIDGPQGRILGFVDLQKDSVEGISQEDKDYLGALATAFSALMVNEQLKDFLRELEALRDRLELASQEEEVFDYIAPFAREQLDVDVVIYYRLGYGNGVPIPVPFQRGAWFPRALEEGFQRRNPPPVKLVSAWNVVFEKDSRTNPELFPGQTGSASGKDYFILREDIRSTAFLPVGTKEHRIGALFLNYRDRMTFSPTDRLMLNTFLQTIIPYLETMRRKDETGKGFERDMMVLHDILGRSINTGGDLLKITQKVKEAQQLGMDRIAQDRLETLEKTLNEHISEINSVSFKTIVDLRTQLEQGLNYAFAVVDGQMKVRYPESDFDWRIYPPRLSTELPVKFRLAIHSIAVEAANNAMRAGKAGWVNITVEQEESEIILTVESNGQPWNCDNPEQPRSKHGIYNRLDIARTMMLAAHEWQNHGRCLIVRFPILPTFSERNHPYDQ